MGRGALERWVGAGQLIAFDSIASCAGETRAGFRCHLGSIISGAQMKANLGRMGAW